MKIKYFSKIPMFCLEKTGHSKGRLPVNRLSCKKQKIDKKRFLIDHIIWFPRYDAKCPMYLYNKRYFTPHSSRCTSGAVAQ